VRFSNQVYTQPVPAHLGGGGFDGDAIWFTSPLDPATGRVAHKANGSPLYLRNVIYYLVVPNGHSGLYGYDCAGDLGPSNYDDACPHKVLIRKVIDFAGPSVDEASEEQPMSAAQVLPYLTRPTGLNAARMSAESGGGNQVGPVQIVARELLWFSCNSKPPLPASPVQLELRASNLLRAQKSLVLGAAPLYSSALTEEARLTEILVNP
jgi:hypothetical protein